MPLHSTFQSLIVVAGCLATIPGVAAEPDAAARQVLTTHCLSCHSGQSPRGGLDFTTRASLLEGGEAGEVVDLKQPEKSRLLALINHTAEPGMPFKREKLPADQIEILTKWVTVGAPYSATLEVPKWWSLRPLSKPAVPAVAAELQSWPLNPVDHFVAAAWSTRQLGPTPAADKRTLLRRVYFDLIGLPPTPAEMEAFLADAAPDAYENVVDRLLESPHYGERWARFWMDLAHFAETHGHD